MIAYITDFIENYCGKRRFKETTYTNEEYDLPDGIFLFLRQFPISTLTLAQFFSGTLDTPSWTTFDVNSYQLYGNEGYVKFFGGFEREASQSRLLRFTYTAGFKIDFANPYTATHTLPHDLTMVATQLTAKIFKLRTSEGIKSESTEGQSITYDKETDVDNQITFEQKGVLENYKRQPFAF